MATQFSSEALKFLRGLKKNNDREWFGERKDVYEKRLKEPMLALIGEVNEAMAEFSPEHLRPANKILMRIYRDIRFSKDKRPYKHHVSAWWARDGLQKTSGGGFYLQVSSTDVLIAAGVYMPEREQLLAIRRYLVDHHLEFRKIMAGRKLRSLMQETDTLSLTRPPKGCAADDPAIDLVMCKQWGLSATLPVERATSPGLLKDVVERFKVAAPLIRLLNTPLIAKPRRPLF
jgi:uncharacterized protein (TIGR02453 family)